MTTLSLASKVSRWSEPESAESQALGYSSTRTSEKRLLVTGSNCKLHARYGAFWAEPCLETGEVRLMDEKARDALTIEELAVYLKIPKSTLYKLVQEGKILS